MKMNYYTLLKYIVITVLMGKYGRNFNLLMANHYSLPQETICSSRTTKKHKNDYSVSVLYLANLNLPRPRNMRSKWDNITVVGNIPGMDNEPGSFN